MNVDEAREENWMITIIAHRNFLHSIIFIYEICRNYVEGNLGSQIKSESLWKIKIVLISSFSNINGSKYSTHIFCYVNIVQIVLFAA